MWKRARGAGKENRIFIFRNGRVEDRCFLVNESKVVCGHDAVLTSPEDYDDSTNCGTNKKYSHSQRKKGK